MFSPLWDQSMDLKKK